MGEVLRLGKRTYQDSFLKLRHEPLEAWCRRWGLEPFIGECFKCKGPLLVNVPMVGEGHPGLMARACACGYRSVPFELQMQLSVGLLYPDRPVRWRKYRRRVVPFRRPDASPGDRRGV